MPINSPDLSFTDDSRAVSGVVGFVLIFAILMILLSINQAQIVPQENREIEFQHFQDVRNDMVEVRSGISTAGQANVSQYPTVNLGTSYPTRILAVNPPPPTGTLETSPRYNISIRNEPGANPENVSTRFLEYRNGYHEMDIGSMWYEHSVLYLDERDNDGEIVVIEDQNLIRSDGSARVNALQNEYRESSSGRVTIELYPTKRSEVVIGDLSGDIIVEIPTRLNHSEYWNDSLGEYDAYNGVEENAIEEGVHLLNLTVDAESLQFGTVGIDAAPDGEGSTSQGVGPGGGDGEDGDTGDTGDPLPDNAVAFDDENGNGVYDSKLEQAYPEEDFDSNAEGREGDFEGMDIILKESITVDTLEMQAKSFEAVGVQIETLESGAQTLIIETGEGMDLSQSTIISKDGSGKINLLASQESEGYTIDIRNTELRSNNDVEATTPGGYLRFNQANGGPGTQILKKNGNAQDLYLCEGTKDGENGVDQPEIGEISKAECNRL